MTNLKQFEGRARKEIAKHSQYPEDLFQLVVTIEDALKIISQALKRQVEVIRDGLPESREHYPDCGKISYNPCLDCECGADDINEYRQQLLDYLNEYLK